MHYGRHCCPLSLLSREQLTHLVKGDDARGSWAEECTVRHRWEVG
jgi:hypothetical protein